MKTRTYPSEKVRVQIPETLLASVAYQKKIKLFNTKLTSTSIEVYGHIAKFYNSQKPNQPIYMSRNRLARRMNTTVGTISKHTTALHRAGFIDRKYYIKPRGIDVIESIDKCGCFGSYEEALEASKIYRSSYNLDCNVGCLFYIPSVGKPSVAELIESGYLEDELGIPKPGRCNDKKVKVATSTDQRGGQSKGRSSGPKADHILLGDSMTKFFGKDSISIEELSAKYIIKKHRKNFSKDFSDDEVFLNGIININSSKVGDCHGVDKLIPYVCLKILDRNLEVPLWLKNNIANIVTAQELKSNFYEYYPILINEVKGSVQ